jgi:hypothetical protein
LLAGSGANCRVESTPSAAPSGERYALPESSQAAVARAGRVTGRR